MWQSKKDHTSFVKSFLHHEPAEAETSNQVQAIPENKQGDIAVTGQGPKGKAGAIIHALINPSTLEEREIFLKVLGI
jgi:hypothetical protein